MLQFPFFAKKRSLVKQKIFHILKSQTFKNSYWSIVDVTVYPAVMIFATAFFIQKLGAEQYGVWMLVNSLMASIGVLNLGLADATIKYISQYRALQDNYAVLRIIRTTFSIYVGLAVILVVISFSIGLIINHFGWFHIEIPQRLILANCIKVSGIILGSKFIEQVFLAIFRGFERYDISAQLSTISKLTIIGCQVILVSLNYQIVEVFQGVALIMVLLIFIESIVVKLYFHNVSFRPYFDKSTFKEVFSYGLWSWLQSVFIIVASQLDKFAIASLVGLKILAYYSIGYTVYIQLHSIFAASVSWIFPAVSLKIQRKESILPLYYQSRFMLFCSALIIVSLLVFTGPWIFKQWLGDIVFAKSYPFIFLFLCYEILIVLNIIPYYFLNGGGFVQLNTWFEFFTKLLNLISMFLFFQYFGVIGLIYGLIVSLVVTIPIQNYFLTNKVLVGTMMHKNILVIIPSLLSILLFNISSPILFTVVLVALLSCTKWLFFDTAFPNFKIDSVL